MIDDATSWSWGRFVERDATPHNMGGVVGVPGEKWARWTSTRTAIRCARWHRSPDGARQKNVKQTGWTQLGRALRELGIGFDFALYAAIADVFPIDLEQLRKCG